MAVGFQCFNDSNTVQITDTNVTLSMTNKGSVWVRAGAWVTVSVTGRTAPILFARPPNGVKCIAAYPTRYGSTNSWQIYCSTGATVHWYVFDYMPQNSPTGPGMAIYGASGQLIYATSVMPLHILSATALSRSNTTSLPTANVARPSNRTVAVCNTTSRSRAASRWAEVHEEAFTIGTSNVTLDGGGVGIGEYEGDWGTYEHGWNTTLLVADVTGY